MKKIYIKASLQGFTIIEVLVTIIVAAIFIVGMSMLYLTITKSTALTRNRAVANDLAYSYLRKYATAGGTPTWFVCDTSNSSGNTNDLTVNQNATGQNLESGTLTSANSGLPSPVTYSVKALAIYGCNGANVKKPIRVDSTVTYGPSNIVIKHSTIVGY